MITLISCFRGMCLASMEEELGRLMLQHIRPDFAGAGQRRFEAAAAHLGRRSGGAG